MSRCEQTLSASGLTEVSMQNAALRLTIQADAGGKVSELVDRQSGRNWLWRNPHVPVRSAQYGADFGNEMDSGGWDEILLSITPGELTCGDGLPRSIPDHGDVVGQAWSVTEAGVGADGRAVCAMSVSGRAMRYEFSRTIALHRDDPRLDVRYLLSNREPVSLPWYWSMHALLAATAGLRVELPRDQAYRVDSAWWDHAAAAELREIWPHFEAADGTRRDLSRFFDSGKTAIASKIFVRSPDSGVVGVTIEGGSERLEVRYDPAELPWLGLWLNDRGWSGCGSEPYVNLGLEPSTVGYDCVSQAVNDGSLQWLEPGECKAWALTLELSA